MLPIRDAYRPESYEHVRRTEPKPRTRLGSHEDMPHRHNRRHRPTEPPGELEVDTFEHVEPDEAA